LSEVVKVKKMIGVAIGIIFFLVGIGIVSYYVKTEIANRKSHEIYEQTKAEVIGYEYSREGQAAVVVQYMVNNEAYTMTSNCYSNNPEKIGEQLEVEYEIRYPRRAVLITPNNDIIVLVIGSFFAVASVFIFLVAIQETEKEDDWIIRGGSLC